MLCTTPQSEVGSVFEVTFNRFTTVRGFRMGQNDRADDLMASNLCSQKCFPFRKLIRVGEFYELPTSTDIRPFILHLFDLALVPEKHAKRKMVQGSIGALGPEVKRYGTDMMHCGIIENWSILNT